MGFLSAASRVFGAPPPVAITPAMIGAAVRRDDRRRERSSAEQYEAELRRLRQSLTGTLVYSGMIASLDPTVAVRGAKWYGEPGKMGIAQQMMLESDVRQSVSYLTAPICGATPRFRPASKDPVDVEAADYATYVLLERLPWVMITERILRTAFADGFSLSEITDDEAPIPASRFPLHPGGGSGVVVTGVHEIPSSTVYRWYQNPENTAQMAGIQQYTMGGDNEDAGFHDLSADRILRLTYDQHGADYEGTALLRSAYPYWKLKLAFLTLLAIKHDRLSVGIPVATVDKDAVVDKTDLDNAFITLSAMRAGAKNAIVLPAGMTFKWEGAGKDLGSNIELAIQICDQQIAKNVAAGFMLLGLQGGGGSYALGSTQQGQHHLFVSFQARRYENLWNLGADGWSPVERLIRMNYGAEVGIPWLQIRNLPTSPWSETIPLLVNAANVGVVTPDARIENQVREALGFDDLDEDTARPRGGGTQGLLPTARDKREASEPIEPANTDEEGGSDAEDDT